MDNSLKHFGILGMKWGVRRTQDQLKRKTPSPQSSDYQKSRELSKKKKSSLTNAELKAYVDRMNLERQYNQLSKDNRSAGQKFAQEILRNSAKQLASNYVAKFAGVGLEALLKKAGG